MLFALYLTVVSVKLCMLFHLGWTGSGAADAGSGARRGIDGDQALEGDAV